MLYSDTECIAFEAGRRVAQGPFAKVARAFKRIHDRGERVSLRAPIFLLDARTSEPIEFDWRGEADDVAERASRLPARAGAEAPASEDRNAQRGPGRPRLGVVAREVTLLPRHWEWLAAQPGGASVALRKLVESARKGGLENDRARQARDAAYRFIFMVAGNDAGFEEAARALFAGDLLALSYHTAAWPADIRAHLDTLLAGASTPETPHVV